MIVPPKDEALSLVKECGSEQALAQANLFVRAAFDHDTKRHWVLVREYIALIAMTTQKQGDNTQKVGDE